MRNSYLASWYKMYPYYSNITVIRCLYFKKISFYSNTLTYWLKMLLGGSSLNLNWQFLGGRKLLENFIICYFNVKELCRSPVNWISSGTSEINCYSVCKQVDCVCWFYYRFANDNWKKCTKDTGCDRKQVIHLYQIL